MKVEGNFVGSVYRFGSETLVSPRDSKAFKSIYPFGKAEALLPEIA